jgi:glycogen operon protein
MLEGDRYSNYSGTGNTINANNAVVRRLIQDSLRHWVTDYHVDGFRFDLASILARDERGRLLDNPHTLSSIETDPVLVDTKLIAEPWDAGGLYQVGSFIGDRWKEWNGKFRDDVRAFVRGDPKVVRAIPNRLFASPDLYEADNVDPEQSVNFVTCHDGMTLNDAVSYNYKHNDANGEQNRDGHAGEICWNHGAEGPTSDLAIEALRVKQIKNLLTITLVSIGVPMLLMGDECRRSQRGNNNAYCQDNEISWFDWSLVEKNASLVRFVRELVRWRREWRAIPDTGSTLAQLLHEARLEWHGTRLGRPDWSDQSHTVAVKVGAGRAYFIFNAYWEALDFELPECTAGGWCLLLDTARPSPDDVHPYQDAPRLRTQSMLRVAARSTVLLISADSRVAGPIG